MTHPTINRIDDVLPHIAGRDEFVVAKRDGYQVIDYNFALADSFEDPMRLECRGLKFAPDGRILARPLHKFFNVGERGDTQPHVLDFSQPHVVTEKLDGSMIHPAIVGGEVVLMTRMGRTDVARKAERLLTPSVSLGCRAMLERVGVTPIFEFTAPDNRIVVRYEESQLSLLAARNNVTGAYDPPDFLAEAAGSMGVPLVRHLPSAHATGQAFADYARAVTDMEGFVVRFDSGLWVKAKGEDYVLKHRAKDSILQEKNVLALIMAGGLDDVLPLLEADDRAKVERYRDQVSVGITKVAARLRVHVESGSALDQKTFAIEHQERIAPELRPLAFSVRAGKLPAAAIMAAIEKNTGSQSSVDSVRHLFGGVVFDAANDNAAEAVAA